MVEVVTVVVSTTGRMVLTTPSTQHILLEMAAKTCQEELYFSLVAQREVGRYAGPAPAVVSVSVPIGVQHRRTNTT